jgi:hypothetical protein
MATNSQFVPTAILVKISARFTYQVRSCSKICAYETKPKTDPREVMVLIILCWTADGLIITGVLICFFFYVLMFDASVCCCFDVLIRWAVGDCLWCVDDCVDLLMCWCVDPLSCWWLSWCVDDILTVCWCVDDIVLMCWCDVLDDMCVGVLMCWSVDVLMTVLICWCVDVLITLRWSRERLTLCLNYYQISH